MAGQAEGAIDRQPGEARVLGSASSSQHRGRWPARSASSPAPVVADGKDRRGRRELPIRPSSAAACRATAAAPPRDEVGLGDGDHAALHPEQPGDLDMLEGLRHHPLVGGNHQQHRIDTGGAGDHGADEALMPRHVDQVHPPRPAQRRMREAEGDRDAAPLLLRQPVGIDAGQGADQRRLAVVDMADDAERPAASWRPGAPHRRGDLRHFGIGDRQHVEQHPAAGDAPSTAGWLARRPLGERLGGQARPGDADGKAGDRPAGRAPPPAWPRLGSIQAPAPCSRASEALGPGPQLRRGLRQHPQHGQPQRRFR